MSDARIVLQILLRAGKRDEGKGLKQMTIGKLRSHIY